MRGTTKGLEASLVTATRGFEPDAPVDGTGVYVRDNVLGGAHRAFTVSDLDQVGFAADDLSTVALTSAEILSAEPDVPATAAKAYEYRQSYGEARLASRLPGSDAPIMVPAGIAGANQQVSLRSDPAHTQAVSDDGRHVFVATHIGSNGAPGESADEAVVYRRTDGTTSGLATPSQRTVSDPEGQKRRLFQMATPDGRFVFFTSAELLTDDANTGPTRAGMDLYRYDFDSDELVDVSATPGGDGAKVHRVVAVADDGQRVYYVARGVVTGDPGPGGEPAVDGELNLYLWDAAQDTTRFVTRLDAADRDVWRDPKAAITTPDGGHLMLQSVRDLTGYASGGATQTYLYDAPDTAGDAASLDCVSCLPGSPSPSGVRPSGNDGLPDGSLSADGRYVLFETEDSHVARDVNGESDVYAWTDGSVELLSTGVARYGAEFAGASATGADIFFETRAQLVPTGIDSNVDVYAASVNGGVAAQHPAPMPSCEGDQCQGAGSTAPGAAPALTRSFSGSGNVDHVRPRRIALRIPRKARRTAARRGVLPVRLRTNRAGTVRVVARAKLGGRVRRVVVVRRRVGRPGAFRARLRLSTPARRTLVRRGRLRLRVVARMPDAKPRSITLTLRRGGRR